MNTSTCRREYRRAEAERAALRGQPEETVPAAAQRPAPAGADCKWTRPSKWLTAVSSMLASTLSLCRCVVHLQRLGGGGIMAYVGWLVGCVVAYRHVGEKR